MKREDTTPDTALGTAPCTTPGTTQGIESLKSSNLLLGIKLKNSDFFSNVVTGFE